MAFSTNQVLFINSDDEYGADELGLPYRDIVAEGVVGSSDFAVSQRAAGANMSVDVAAGACWVKGDDDPDLQPTYRYREPAATNLAVGAADATDPRVDRVVAEILDDQFSGVSKLGRLRVVAGTPTSGATLDNLSGAASVPNTALLLADVLVPAAASSIVTADIRDRRPKSGREQAFNAITADATITGTTPATATTLLTADAVECDGSPIDIEVFSPMIVGPNNTTTNVYLALFEDGTQVGVIGDVTSPAALNYSVPLTLKYRHTPSAGRHVYSIRGYGASPGGARIGAGSGGTGTGALLQAFVRILRAS